MNSLLLSTKRFALVSFLTGRKLFLRLKIATKKQAQKTFSFYVESVVSDHAIGVVISRFLHLSYRGLQS
jgi:hypothetical protein